MFAFLQYMHSSFLVIQWMVAAVNHNLVPDSLHSPHHTTTTLRGFFPGADLIVI